MIFFDIDGTLFDHTTAERLGAAALYEQYKSIFGKMGFEQFYSQWCGLSDKYFKHYLSHQCTFEGQRAYRMQELFGHVGIPLSYDRALERFDCYRCCYERSWRSFEDVIPCLKSLSDHRLGIISNGHPD